MSSTSSSACVHYVPYVILVEDLQAPQMIEKHIKVKKNVSINFAIMKK